MLFLSTQSQQSLGISLYTSLMCTLIMLRGVPQSPLSNSAASGAVEEEEKTPGWNEGGFFCFFFKQVR